MLSILKNKQTSFIHKPLDNTYINNEKYKIQNIYKKHANNKIIYYPSSSKE